MSKVNALDSNSKEYKLFKEQLEKNLDTFLTKNHDYGDSFFSTWKKMGVKGILSAYSRISDKFNRFEHYVLNLRDKGGFACDESVMDTLIDMANYAIMTAVAIQLNSNAVSKEEVLQHASITTTQYNSDENSSKTDSVTPINTLPNVPQESGTVGSNIGSSGAGASWLTRQNTNDNKIPDSVKYQATNKCETKAPIIPRRSTTDGTF